MDEIYVYFVELPDHIKEIVTPCLDGYTIYIEESLDPDSRAKAYNHALAHITYNDFNFSNVNILESMRHKWQ